LEVYFDCQAMASDVSFYFSSGQTIAGHRIILASRSTYFRNFFTGSSSQSPSISTEKVAIDANYNLFYTLVRSLLVIARANLGLF